MYNVFRVIMLSLFLIPFVGCATPASKAPEPMEPVYPALSEIPPIPDYIDGGQSWNTDAVCWVSMTDDAKWNNIEGAYAQTQFSSVILPLIREELSNEGYQVKIFDSDYITRDKRLSIQRIVLCKHFEIKKTMVKQGVCHDMKLTLDVINNSQQQENTQCEVWGRSLVISGERKPWVDVYRECVSNLHKVPEFRKALEVDPPI